MPNRMLTPVELERARVLLGEIRGQLVALAGDDAELLFAYRRKIAKELIYDERSPPMVRRRLKAQKRVDQEGQCARCHAPLPEKYVVLDRIEASRGYTAANTRLICEKCDREIQEERRYK